MRLRLQPQEVYDAIELHTALPAPAAAPLLPASPEKRQRGSEARPQKGLNTQVYINVKYFLVQLEESSGTPGVLVQHSALLFRSRSAAVDVLHEQAEILLLFPSVPFNSSVIVT